MTREEMGQTGLKAELKDCPGNLACYCMSSTAVILLPCCWLPSKSSLAHAIGWVSKALLQPSQCDAASGPCWVPCIYLADWHLQQWPLNSAMLPALVLLLSAWWVPPHSLCSPDTLALAFFQEQVAMTTIGPVTQQCSQVMLYLKMSIGEEFGLF